MSEGIYGANNSQHPMEKRIYDLFRDQETVGLARINKQFIDQRGSQYFTELYLVNVRWMSTGGGAGDEHTIRIIPNLTGDVLLAGLGLGCDLILLEGRRDVTSITVVENSQDIIDLVGPKFTDPKITIIHNSIENFGQLTNRKYDSIFYDTFWYAARNSLVADQKNILDALDILKVGGRKFFWEEEVSD